MKKVLILGSGPNRIGQGIEFDYACVHAVFALKEQGIRTIMLNCNPETVSTDYDTADALYFEPIVLENVLEVIRREKPDGVFLQFGGQTPLKLSLPLKNLGINIHGITTPHGGGVRNPILDRRPPYMVCITPFLSSSGRVYY